MHLENKIILEISEHVVRVSLIFREIWKKILFSNQNFVFWKIVSFLQKKGASFRMFLNALWQKYSFSFRQCSIGLPPNGAKCCEWGFMEKTGLEQGEFYPGRSTLLNVTTEAYGNCGPELFLFRNECGYYLEVSEKKVSCWGLEIFILK